ncbi:4-hydroxyphenylacetate 3-hydroxylase N-terminal domain-containing protein [Agrococcus terreus]|uniref:4-hydroxyphenylacetate 3-monooxygenase, oxygenase component n=1 Tax=Agrococcus terreus TaxID=574649 RepID=A0ABQ2KHB1_9MICO|nr:4-hydroxyphenylacetate 3-hydroxylase N-terminal domain-containing protein [Agrococcus terreus]GGN81900.1 4-hydroxyphenylacetate 3-monooxygenase, oxygenase component [Agrococcus terreus]
MQTGADYLASLDDGRVVVLDGQPVADVAAHPAFAGATTTIASLYDSLHGPDAEALLAEGPDCAPTHAFWAIPRSRDDLRAQREAIRAWQRTTHGWMGRTPEMLASVVTSMAAHASFYGDQADAVRGVHARDAAAVTHYAQALVNPPVDRELPPDEVGDVFLHVVRETDEGLVLRGAKAVVTGAATAQRLLVSHFGGEVRTDAFAIAASVPVGAPGVRLYVRGMPTGADQPLATRFAEHDALVVLDDVLVPWHDVLIRDAATMLGHNRGAVGWNARLAFQSATRLEAKLEHIAGLAERAVEILGTSGIRGVQAALGEVVAFRHVVAGMRDAMIEQAAPVGDDHPDGRAWGPGVEPAMAFSAYAPDAYSRMRILLQTTLASGLAHLPLPVDALAAHPDVAPLLRGSGGADAATRLEVLGTLHDAIVSGFGARHELYERSHWGQPERTHVGILGLAQAQGRLDGWRGR